MNENPEGTPNPLNNTPEAVAPEATPTEPVVPVEAQAEPTAEPAPATTAEPSVDAADPAAEATPVTENTPAAATPVAAPAKKKKGGLIAGIICLVIALGCGIAALLVLFVFNKGGDAVTDGILKLMNGDNRNIGINGTADLDALGTTLSINFDGKFDTVAQAGEFNANVASNYNGLDINITAAGKKVGGGDAYLMVSGVKDIYLNSLKQYGIDCTAIDCEAYFQSMPSGSDSGITSLVQIDSKWVKIPMDAGSISNLPVSLPGGIDLGSFGSEKNQIIELYKKYPFLVSSTDGLGISKKNDTLYKITYDYDKMASFVNELNTCDEESYCVKENVTADQLKATLGGNNEYYVEVNNNHDITRLYVKNDSEGTAKSTIDMTISYPSSVNIEAPSDFTESDNIFSIFNMFGGLNQGGSSYNTQGDSYDWSFDDEEYDYSDSVEYDSEDYDWNWITE